MCRWSDVWYVLFFLVCIFVIVCVSFFSLSLCTCMYYEQYMPLDFGLKVAHQHEGESQRGPSTLHEWCWVPFAQGRAVGDWFTHFMHLKYHPTQDNSYSNTSSKHGRQLTMGHKSVSIKDQPTLGTARCHLITKERRAGVLSEHRYYWTRGITCLCVEMIMKHLPKWFYQFLVPIDLYIYRIYIYYSIWYIYIYHLVI